MTRIGRRNNGVGVRLAVGRLDAVDRLGYSVRAMTAQKAPGAIIIAGGTQHLVSVGQTMNLATMPGNPGDTVTFDRVLLVTEPSVKIGTPTVAGAKVTATIVGHGKTKKVTGVKFHNKVRYRRTFGHRQGYTTVKIEKIG